MAISCSDNQGYQHFIPNQWHAGLTLLAMTKRPRTSERTLYRLLGVPATANGLTRAVSKHIGDRKLDEMSAARVHLTIEGSPAIWIGIPGRDHLAEWCVDASTITGLDLTYDERRAGGILLIAVDGTVYAIAFGAGYPLLPDEITDQGFGRNFIIRRLDPDQVCDLVRRRPESRGRTESVLVPAGAPVWTLGIQESIDIIRRAGGWAKDLKVTFTSGDDRPVKIEGCVGLRMRFGVNPSQFIADIRECARVCREEEPHPALAFIANIQPVADPDIRELLNMELDDLLGPGGDKSRLLPVVPTSALDDFRQARRIAYKIGPGKPPLRPELTLDYFLVRTRSMRPGTRRDALRNGRVILYADDDGREELASVRADKWLEISVPDGSRHYFLLDGEWYEIGGKYAENARHEIAPLFVTAPALTLPEWRPGETEGDYNLRVAGDNRGVYLCLDKSQRVRNPLGRRSSLEICDLVGPGNELIHVKFAERSEPLSHLFFQGMNSALSFIYGPADVRERFIADVSARGRTLPANFMPHKVVFAILLKKGEQLTPSTLFPFTQASLAHAARTLHTYRGIKVEIVGIQSA